MFLFTFKKFKIIFQLDRNIGLEHKQWFVQVRVLARKRKYTQFGFGRDVNEGTITKVWAS